MNRDEYVQIDMLVDWHLNRLDEEDRARMEDALQEDPELREACERLGRILQPLDHWSVPPPSPNLAGRVLSHITDRRSPTGADKRFGQETGPTSGRPVFLSRNVIAAAACIALLIGVLAPGISQIRANSRRAMCANNLSMIFRGVSAYRQSFSDTVPYAGMVAGASWLPGTTSGRPFASNSRHLYLLVKGRFDPAPKHFVCPACSTSKPMRPRDATRRDDFPRACNLSYASMNMSGPSPNLRPRPTMAFVGDANPLFVKGRFDSSVDADRTNSRAHGGRGQTVLLLNGSTSWMTSPVNAADHDNVWLAGDIRRYTGVETPVGKEDAHLVPGYPATDPLVSGRY